LAADFVIKQGDTGPAFAYTLVDDDGSTVNLTGASGLALTLRSHTQATPVTLTGTASIVNAAGGQVQFAFSAADTGAPGLYQATWNVTLSGGQVRTFPRTGYLWVSIEENLTTSGGQTLVSLPDVKDYLNLPASDRTHDAEIMRFIGAVRPVVEAITGPILPTVREEWHDGGQYFIRLRRRPSSTYGTSPVLDLIGVTETRGPIAYALKVIEDPAHGELYSCMLDTYGFVTRRTTGGGVIAFPPMTSSVHVWYRAGQSSVPANVYEGTLELIRVNYQQTQQSGRSRAAARGDDETPQGPSLGFFVPRRVRELLAPNKRAPAVF
jgi:hypothetical protein